MALVKTLGGGSLTVKDEGSNLSTAVTSIDFVGAGVTATGTTAVTVTIPSASGAEQLIGTDTPSGTGTGTFSSLGSYTDLRLRVRGRGTASALFVDIKLTFNGDTGANYDYEFHDVSGTAAGGANQSFGAAYIHVGYLAAATAAANTPTLSEILIGDYAGTTFHKAVLVASGLKEGTSSGNLFIAPRSGWWRNTAAITSVTYTLSSGNFVAGSKVSLYGIL